MLLFADGFDKYSVDADLALRIPTGASASLYETSSGKWGGGCIKAIAGNTITNCMYISLPETPVGNIIHMAAHIEPLGTLASNVYGFGFRAGASVFGLYMGASAVPYIFKYGASGTSLAALSPSPFAANTWVHFELAALIHATSGWVKVWIDGVLVVNYSGSTATGTIEAITQFWACTLCGAAHTRFDDLVIWNDVGSSFTHTQLDQHRISTLTPNAAGAHFEWTPNAGNNYEAVDEAGFADGATTYVESDTVNEIDTYNCENLSYVPATVFGVQVATRSYDLGYSAKLKPVLRSGLTDSLGAEFNSSNALKQVNGLWVTDPHTGSAWTPTGVNSAQIGIKHTA